MATTIGIGPRYGNNCCVCCDLGATPSVTAGDACYCNCCACPPQATLTFEMIACQVQGNPTKPCDCNDFTFEMQPRTAECYLHSDGVLNPGGALCTPCDGEYTSQPTGSYIEAWGFRGTVCGDCTTSVPPFSGDDCDGMCITASLCCCKTGVVVTGDLGYVHPCPIESAVECSSLSADPDVGEPNGNGGGGRRSGKRSYIRKS